MNKDNKLRYKHKQERILIDSLSQSALINKQQLREIWLLYNKEVPYHNFIHALKMSEQVLKLNREEYSIIEIQSLFVAALFHDAGHSWIAWDLDEFRSLDLAFHEIEKFEKKYNYIWIDYSIVRKAIIWTVFKNRKRNQNKYAILMADLDVCTIWMSFPEFLYYADFPISVEFQKDILDWFHDFNYFNFLLWVNKHIFLHENIRETYPNYLRNIKKYISIKESSLIKIYNYWKENDISYDEFEDFYKKNISFSCEV